MESVTDYLFDTNCFINYFNGFQREPEYFQLLNSNQHTGAFSVITEAELWVGQGFLGLKPDEERTYRELFRHMRRISVTGTIAREGARIRRNTRLELPDALIAATALVMQRKLLTRNRELGRLDPSLVEIVQP